MGDSSNTAISSAAAATAMGTGYNDATVIHRRVKKEDGVEAEGHNMYHNGKYNNNKNGAADNCNLNHEQVLPAKVKKEEEGNNNKNDDQYQEDEEEASTPKSINDNYDDWTKGNWCWLLPAAANNTTNHSVKSEEPNDDTKNNARNPKGIMTAGRRHHRSKCSGSATTGIIGVAATSTAKRQRGRHRSLPHDNNGGDDNDNGNGNINDDDDDNERKPPAKKKMRRHLSKSDTHTKAKDNYNDDEGSTNDSNNGVDDGEGYESWTEGNWCLILPVPAAIDDDIETGPSTTIGRRGVRNRSSRKHPFTNPVEGIDDNDDDDNEDDAYEDDGDNEYNKDSDHDDDNDAVSSTKAGRGKDKTGRCTSFYDKRWDEYFQRLVAYKKEYNSTTVPYTYRVNNLNLGNWVGNQRANFKNKGLSVERTKRLKSIGFELKTKEDNTWLEMYKILVAYKKQHKSTNVPSKYKKDPKLGSWVDFQRQSYRKNKLSEERISLLESIGFVWNTHDVQWMAMYNKLVEYKRQHHGSTLVPQGYTEDFILGRWVSQQRHKDNLSGKRLELLNAIDFVWSVKKIVFF